MSEAAAGGGVLTLNAGSSSLKFGLYDGDAREIASGQVERLGAAACLRYAGETREIGSADHARALRVALDALAPLMDGAPRGIGHRVVHGGAAFDAPAPLDDAVMERLEALTPLAPLHQPHNLSGVRAAREAFPGAVQVACFDTAFHRAHPWVNDVFAIPHRFYDEGVRRYGFHGLSYEHIVRRLARERPAIHAGKAVIAHLGNGASLCAVVNGRAWDTSMAFSPLDGVPMGTRSGAIDPAVLLYLLERGNGGAGMDADELSDMLYRRSGLVGLSGVSSDMRALLASEEPRAAGAVAHFCARVRREIGALAASMGGLDGLVFTGGIGENAAPVRAMICDELGFLGIALDPARNDENADEIGTGATPVLRLATDEEGVIARAVLEAL